MELCAPSAATAWRAGSETTNDLAAYESDAHRFGKKPSVLVAESMAVRVLRHDHWGENLQGKLGRTRKIPTPEASN